MLRNNPYNPHHVLLTGGTGYVGILLIACILQNPHIESLILLVRRNPEEDFWKAIDREMKSVGPIDKEKAIKRIKLIKYDDFIVLDNALIDDQIGKYEIDTIIHAAGCLDYFDRLKLEDGNIVLTEKILELGKKINIRRFIYISTAYSAGYTNGCIPEHRLEDSLCDPTAYTFTKRIAETRIADSGLPFVIIRPSILIGSHRDGYYSGKRYGLYQQWMGLERLMLDRYHAEIHTVATHTPVNMIHQDVFQNSFDSILCWVPDGAYVNLVSSGNKSPTMRDLWALWVNIVRPKRVIYYNRFDDLDLKSIDIRQRAYLTFAQINLEIASHYWQFERGWLNALRSKGLHFKDTTLDSVSRCLKTFIRNSFALRNYQEKYGYCFSDNIQIVEPSSKQRSD